MADHPSFGRLLREYRKINDLTQERLAEQAHCSIETIKKIEAGKLRPSKHLAELLATCFALLPTKRETFIAAARADGQGQYQLAPPGQSESGALVAALPTGTVTFLFTDVAGSTRLWEQHPQAMRDAITRHDAIVRHAIAGSNGVVVKNTGDGFYAAFARAPDAVSAALAAQRALSTEAWGVTGPLRVRMAIHTGVAEERDGDYYGPPLNRAARLLAVGHGGQILISRATQELVCDYLPADTALRDLGTHRLKDLIRPEHIFQLVAPGVATDFPALRTLDIYANNLPSQPTPLIGRAIEITAVRDRLEQAHVRLLTLTGPGGVGKTRLALQLAAELLDDFADGVYFVNLAPVSDQTQVESAIAHTLGVTDTSSHPLREELKRFLHDKHVLLVLDNFEHVVDAAPLLAELLASAARLTMLVTSRSVLRLSGEHEFVVPPLALPARGQLPILNGLTQYEAVQLFIARAQAVQADFAVTNGNAPAVAEICHRLDGLPLAIELAAARIKLFPPAALLKRLGQRLPLLTSGARDLPARQKTLRNTIAWSYDLLDAGAQTLFAQLGVFVDGCTLEAAEAVCTANGDQSVDIIDGIAGLVNQSMLRHVDDPTGEPRLLMLETIREYALERLAGSGELEAMHRRQAVYYQTFAAAVETGLWSPQHKHWMERLKQEHANLRAALEWAMERGETELGLDLAVVLCDLWAAQGMLTEGRAQLSKLLTQAQASPPTLARLKVLHGASTLANNQGDIAAERALWDERLRLARELGDPVAIAEALQDVGFATWRYADATAGRQLVEQSLASHRTLGNQRGVGQALLILAFLTAEQGDYGTARSLGEQSLAIARGHAGESLISTTLLQLLGEIARLEGDFRLARAYHEQYLALGRAWNDTWIIAQAGANLSFVMLNEGDTSGAAALFQEVLLANRQAARRGIPLYLVGLGGVASLRRQPERAARLLAAATALLDTSQIPLETTDRRDYDRIMASVREQLAESAFAAEWATGQAMTVEQAIAYALSSND